MVKLVADQIVDYLERRGITYVFGLCGHTVIAMLDALSRSEKITYVSNRHEQIAATAADGYARVTHKASVLICHLGPGLTNATTGVANASLDGIPMVVIAGDVPSYYFGKHPHQEVNMHADGDQFEIYRPFVKRAWRIDDPESLPRILDRAFTLAESGKPGPVLISVPMDMFSREIPTELFERTFKNTHDIAKPALDKTVARKIAERLLSAQSPVIHVGGGVRAAQGEKALQDLVDYLQIPVSRTLMAQSVLPDTHPLMLGQTGFWGSELTHSYTSQADLILGVGTRFAEADSSSWYDGLTFDTNKTAFIQIDIEPQEIGRNYPVEIGAASDPRLALEQILEEVNQLQPEPLKNPEIIEKIAKSREAFEKENHSLKTDSRLPMTPQRILWEVKQVLPEDALIFTDVGWNKNGVAQQYAVTQIDTIHHPSGLATMGFGPAAVIGAKLAAPEKVVVTLVGDGGFGTNPSVLATAREMALPIIWIVMNNSAFGTIAGLENAHYHTEFGTVFTADGQPYSPDWAQVAKGYGIQSVKIHSADELGPQLKIALEANAPFLIDCPMENIPVPTPGAWNINDIYTKKPGIINGRQKFADEI
ncbi:MAG: thiamine pyrophosphate-binding protein [Anaerolineaceae bacterium]|nr:thiamine pyrophosphate-binding protein [Anaerolineaceae bacterium]